MNQQSNPENLATAGEVIDRLGGDAAVGRLLGGFDTRRVWNWRERGFPPETFVALTAELNNRNLYAPPALWKQIEASTDAA